MNNKEIKQYFMSKYVRGFWNRIKFWFFIRKVYWNKRILHWEINLDKLYFENHFFEELAYDDKNDRLELQKENQKPNKDMLRIDLLEERISHAKAVKESHRRNENLLNDNLVYLQMLEAWFNKDEKTKA